MRLLKNKRLRKGFWLLLSPSCCLTDPCFILRAGKFLYTGSFAGQHKVDCSLAPTPFALLKITLILIHCRNLENTQESIKKIKMTHKFTTLLSLLTAFSKSKHWDSKNKINATKFSDSFLCSSYSI